MPEFQPRRAKPGDRFTVTGDQGQQHEFKAGADGLVRPSSQAESGMLDSLGLAIAHPAAKRKSSSKKKPAAKKAAPAAVVPASPPIDEANPTIEETF